MKTPLISIIVPIGPHEGNWAQLLMDLSFLLDGSVDGRPLAEIILCHCENDSSIFEKFILEKKWGSLMRPVYSEKGRGKQLNEGAKQGRGKFLWFLHADSRLEKSDFLKLQVGLGDYPNRLHYFNLAFLKDGPSFMLLNTFGARIRSDILGVPFGDQGFCLSKKLFWSLSGFREGGEKRGGEDHLFIWEARKNGLKLMNCRGTIFTSSRKYKEKGWLKITLHHLFLTAKVAFPKWLQGQ